MSYINNRDSGNNSAYFPNGTESTSTTGGGQSHSHGDNKPLYYALAFILKL